MNNPHVMEPQESLKAFIDCYYLIQSNDPEYRSCHYSFPSTYNSLTIYKDSAFGFGENYFLARESKAGEGGAIIQQKRQAPLLVDIQGRVDRVTILFKDLGLNQFVRTPLCDIMSRKNSFFTEWSLDTEFRQFKQALFSVQKPSERIALLERFLLGRMVPVYCGAIRKAIDLLCNFEHPARMQSIAEELNLSLRSFNRLFRQTIGVSPVEYRQIAQFRYSLKQKFFSNEFSKLTELGYKSHFYDQSYFTKIYRKLTGNNPKAFFRAINRLGDDRLVFEFLKRQ